MFKEGETGDTQDLAMSYHHVLAMQELSDSKWEQANNYCDLLVNSICRFF